jgi:hydrogenase maturation protease
MATRLDSARTRLDENAASLPRTLVIGLGNPLRGDDGVGVRVIQQLASVQLPPDVEVMDGGTQGLGIVNAFEGRQRVILVDATDMGASPGCVARFTLEQALLIGADEHLSIHAAGLRDALLLAQALDMLPDELVVFGVQPANTEWRTGLSSAVEAVLPHLVAALLAEMGESHQPSKPSALDTPSGSSSRHGRAY